MLFIFYTKLLNFKKYKLCKKKNAYSSLLEKPMKNKFKIGLI